jgi:hypothetical protein
LGAARWRDRGGFRPSGEFALAFLSGYLYKSQTMASDRQANQQRRRGLREQLRALTYEPLMRGSIVERRRKCGKPNCACATDPQARHRGKVVTVFLDGRTRTMPLRSGDETSVRAALEAYQRAWRIINALTACELSDLHRQARERRRAQRRRR